MKRHEFVASSKTSATKQEEEAAKNDSTEISPDSPPADPWDDAVKKLIRSAKKRGYVTRSQVNAALPSEEVTSDQIEDVFAMLNEMGINVVETEETEAEETAEEAREEAEEEEPEGELVEVRSQTPTETK